MLNLDRTNKVLRFSVALLLNLIKTNDNLSLGVLVGTNKDAGLGDENVLHNLSQDDLLNILAQLQVRSDSGFGPYLEEFANDIEGAGGVNCHSGAWNLEGTDWPDLAYTYLNVCAALGRTPAVNEDSSVAPKCAHCNSVFVLDKNSACLWCGKAPT